MGNQGRASQETSVCVCEWGVWGVKQGPVRSLELPLWGASPAGTVPGAGSVTATAWEWSDQEASLTK